MEDEGEGDERPPPRGTAKKSVIKIPSYPEAFVNAGEADAGGASASSTSAPQPNASSFSQAFSFVKSSEFYSPPSPPPPAPSQTPGHAHRHHAAAQSEEAPVAGTLASSSANLVVGSRNAILVSHRQKGNPLLKHIRNVRWMFADVVCDYLLGQNACALYLSLRYHLLHPDYLYYRIRELQKNFKLRVVLCHIDVEDVAKPLLEVTRTTLLHDCTLLCGWSLEECGRYLETIKVYENKSADSIREQMDTDYLSRLTHALTTVRHVNKTDVVTLGSTFGSLSRIMDASMEDLARCPGIGERKVKRLYDTFHEPFRRISSQSTVLSEAAVPSEASVQEKIPGGSSLDADDAEIEEENTGSSKAGEEPSTTVRSALSAAFAKYSDKIRNQERKKRSVVQKEGTSVSLCEGPKCGE